MTGCCTLGAGRNFTACEFFPRKFAEVGGHVRCTNRSKHASDAEYLTLAAAAAQLLVENSVGSGRNRQESNDPNLLRADEFVYPAAPADFARKKGVHKVRQVEEWHEKGE